MTYALWTNCHSSCFVRCPGYNSLAQISIVDLFLYAIFAIIRVHLMFDLLWLTRFVLRYLQEGRSCLAYYLKKWVYIYSIDPNKNDISWNVSYFIKCTFLLVEIAVIVFGCKMYFHFHTIDRSSLSYCSNWSPNCRH